MFDPRKLFSSLTIMSISIFGLISCTPSFKTAAEECITFSPVTLVSTKSSEGTDFKVLANRTDNEYKLYLEDALNSLNLSELKSKASDGTLSDPSADELAAIQYIFIEANNKMGYVIEDGKVSYASNPLDFIESLMVATDEDEVIQTFVDAKQNVAQAIARDDSVCNYRNPSISLIVEDPEISVEDGNIAKAVNAQLNLNYNPFHDGAEKDVDQIILISLYDTPIAEQSIYDRNAKSFAGINRINSSNFKAAGASPSEIRQVNFSDSDTNETFFFDDDFDELKLGQLVVTQFNKVCTLKDEYGEEVKDSNGKTIQAACPEEDGVETRTIVHPSCNGTDPDGVDETGQIQEKKFPVVSGHPDLTDIQRFRIEVDYPDNEIRVYASKYAEAILKADAPEEDYNLETDVIYNPTTCEKQGVLDDLLAKFTEEEQKAPGFEGVRLTAVEDPKYDLIEELDSEGKPKIDENGDPVYITTPIFTFQGTAIPERQQ